MPTLDRHYVGYLNSRTRRTGTLWEGRYRATLIESERYLLTCMRYIELNPVRAGMASRPGDYPYSSYVGNALGAQDPLLTPHALYRRLGKTAAEIRRAYRALFRRRLEEAALKDIREATNMAWALGDERFKAEVQRLTGRRAAPTARGGDQKSKAFQEIAKINRL